AVHEAGMARVTLFQAKEMLAGQQPAKTENATPAKLFTGVCAQHLGLEPHLGLLRRAQDHVQTRADRGLAGDADDERVPLWIRWKIREHLPDFFRRTSNVYLCSQLHVCRGSPLQVDSSRAALAST